MACPSDFRHDAHLSEHGLQIVERIGAVSAKLLSHGQTIPLPPGD